MNSIKTTPWSYVAPQCIIMDIYPEGLICLSDIIGGIGHEGVSGDEESII